MREYSEASLGWNWSLRKTAPAYLASPLVRTCTASKLGDPPPPMAHLACWGNAWNFRHCPRLKQGLGEEFKVGGLKFRRS